MKSSIFRAEPKWAARNFHRSSMAAACRADPVSQECKAMRIVLGAIAVSAALIATDASAQGVNLTGQYRCIEGCYAARPGQLAYVTQNGWELNMVNDAGLASRAGATAGPAAASPLTCAAAGRSSVAQPRETVRGGGRSSGRL